VNPWPRRFWLAVRHPLLLVPYERWGFVQNRWYRQYKRADRKAFAAECEAIRLRAQAGNRGGQ
jgi:hypothetical protein